MIRAFLKKVGKLLKSEPQRAVAKKNLKPTIIPRSEHGISRSQISENALKVLYRLHQHGFQALLVGGGVRDLLLGLHPKDFDVVTNAKPEEVRRVFRNCRLIGRRFRLAHVYFDHDIIEVATFRGTASTGGGVPSHEDRSHSDHGMILRDNIYGTLAEDVWRRDFTINALYYNIADFSVVDYVGGYSDLKAKRLRMIGEVGERYREDPVRMLRAVRFACKANFPLPKELSTPIKELSELITHVASSRLFEEVMKMLHSGSAEKTYEYLLTCGLFNKLFSATAECLEGTDTPEMPAHAFLEAVFKNTDQRIQSEQSVTTSFMVAALLWYPICAQAGKYTAQGVGFFPAKIEAMQTVVSRQLKQIGIPKRFTQGAREIWMLQIRMMKRQAKHVQFILLDPRFRAAFDFLELRAQAGEAQAQPLYQWWKAYIAGDAGARRVLLKEAGNVTKKRKRSRAKRAPKAPESGE